MIHFAHTRLIALVQIAVLMLASAAFAQPETMSVAKAYEAVQANEMILLDIRTDAEWQETGVAKGAWPVNLQSKTFSQKLSAILDANPDKKIGLICATGGRSGYVFGALQKYGVQNIVDVTEGMLGSPAGPGWLKEGLPLMTAQEAIAALPVDFTAK